MTPEPQAPPLPRFVLGDEAVALAALHAGIAAAYAYPGTPSTEILETVERHAAAFGAVAHWTANEKTALEQGLGVSMLGRRVLVAMKHVGLNVAMDAFVNAALVGIRGGLVVAVADDPGMHSSQNEQDSRVLAEFARIPVLEPADGQEAYDLTREAFAVSERYGVPVMVRLVTRLCHGRSEVVCAEPEAAVGPSKPDSPRDWVLLPANARRLWREHLEGRGALEEWAARHAVVQGGEGRRGVITVGSARAAYLDNAPDLEAAPPWLHLGAFPLPPGVVRDFAADLDAVLVLENGYPHVEGLLAGVLPTRWSVEGRRTGALPEDGELTPDTVRAALGLEPRKTLPGVGALPARPPRLCQGCPHRDSYAAMGEALKGFDQWAVTGDIGCYTLGALPPLGAIESCVCMGASIGMAKGASDAGMRPVLAVIGDSTFLHSGVTALMDAAAHDSPMTVLVLDNETVGMTGQQPTILPDSRLLPVILGVGVDPEHVHQIEVHPRRVGELATLLERELRHEGLSVVVGVRECIVAARHRKQAEAVEVGR